MLRLFDILLYKEEWDLSFDEAMDELDPEFMWDEEIAEFKFR